MEDNKLCLEKQPLSDELLNKMNAYWRAANYLSAGQLYLLDNPLLKKPLTMDQIKKKIVGHWGTVPGQNFIYVHCNRVIKRYDLDMILLSGPGHGGNFLIANTYLEGSYSEVYPNISQNEEGMKKMFKQFSFPCGVPSHCAPETPGSINEGGELGYSIAHGFGAVLDNPDLIATVVVGDGEAETGPLATSWQSNKFLNPITDGAVLPILHLNGYKISNPTIFSRISHEEVENFFKGCGWKPYFVEGDDPMTMHRKMAETMDACIEEIKAIQKNARENNDPTRPFWPMIVLRTPKGWTGPKVVDGLQIEGSFRAHQVPLSMESPEHLDLLKEWLESYHAEELFDEKGRLIPELAELAPKGDARLGANPHANGGLLLKDLRLPDFRSYGIEVEPGKTKAQDMIELGGYIRDIFKLNEDSKNFRIFGPDESMSNRLYKVFEEQKRDWQADLLDTDDCLARDGRIMDGMLSEHMCEGWLEGYLLTGRHGFFASYEAFIRIVDSMAAQHAKWLKVCNQLSWRQPIASLNFILTSNVWQQDHNGFTHQDPGFLDHIANKKADVVRMYLPPDTNCLLSCFDHCIKSKNYVNAIVASKHPSCQWLTMEQAVKHCTQGIGIWEWASNDQGQEPDIVMACVGGGSNAMGSFYNFINDASVRLIGCEAAGRGIDTASTAATIATGRIGIFHGMKSYFCQDEYGQIAPVYSISAGLDYPGIGPEHANLYDTGRAKYVPVTDDEAVNAFEYLSKTEGIIPAIESAHAVAHAIKIAPSLDKDKIIVITISGRGDKDCAAIARYRGEDIRE